VNAHRIGGRRGATGTGMSGGGRRINSILFAYVPLCAHTHATHTDATPRSSAVFTPVHPPAAPRRPLTNTQRSYEPPSHPNSALVTASVHARVGDECVVTLVRSDIECSLSRNVETGVCQFLKPFTGECSPRVRKCSCAQAAVPMIARLKNA